VAPDATNISVREVLAKLDTEFASVAQAAENGEFALWVGSGISRQAPNLGDLIERAFEFLRQKAIDPPTQAAFTLALDEAVTLAGLNPANLRPQYANPFATWAEMGQIVKALWDQYSDLLDIRILGERGDFILWEAIDVRTAFAHPKPPSATHLCVGILIMEGAIKTVASANWDGFIEDAVARLSNGAPGILQVIVDPDHLREAPAQAKLLKFHGCVNYATKEPTAFRKYLTGSRTQITEWPDSPEFAPMVNAIINVATNQKTMVLGLSIQDFNLQTIFSKAKQVHAWPWPCTPHAPGHVFCGEQITKGQSNVLKIVYGDAYDTHAIDIQSATHMRAWAEQVLIALVLRVLADKLVRLMQGVLTLSELGSVLPPLQTSLIALRNFIADLAVPDRTSFVNAAVSFWSRMLSIFRSGALPVNPEAYEVLSTYVPATLHADANATAVGLGRLGLVLALLQNGKADGTWDLKLPADANVASGVFTARANRTDATDRPLFVVKSATEAIALQKIGAFANDNAVVIHGDETWQALIGKGKSARKPSSAPGRSGRVETTHVSLGAILSRVPDALTMQQEFATEMML
jgi:hypothetical protein